MIDPATGLEVPDPKSEPEPTAPPAPTPPPAAPPAPAAPAPAPVGTKPGMTEEEIKNLEEQTGLNRKQLNTVAVLVQQGRTTDPVIGKMVEQETMKAAKNAVLAQGVTVIPPELEKKVETVLATLTPAERQNPKLVENIIWIERGKMNNPGTPAPRTTTRVMSGLDDTPPAAPIAGDEDYNKLSDEEKQYYNLGKFTSMKEYREYSKKGISTAYEQNWKPTFGGR